MQVGEVLGAIHGIKALTEGIGPLLFGILMSISEKYHDTSLILSYLPQGWPYILLAILPFLAYRQSHYLLLQQKQCDDYDDLLLLQNPRYRNVHHNRQEDEQELVNLLSTTVDDDKDNTNHDDYDENTNNIQENNHHDTYISST